jgi:anthranilate phosphoribosyltransferase
VPDLQLGGILIALRVKGESLDELAGFVAACEASYAHVPALADGRVPVVIPSYNGGRQLPNLVPLLALLLAREGVPVLVHGVSRDPGRVSTREVFEALGIAPAASVEEAHAQLSARRHAFLPIDTLAPQIANLLSMRARLGVRNSTHTVAKMLKAIDGPAVRIVSVTHPEYLVRMREYFTRYDTDALILRGAEGEAVAHPRREPAIDWAHAGVSVTWTSSVRPERSNADSKDERQALPSREADVTARWIERVLAGGIEIPPAIAHQVECCKRAAAWGQTPASSGSDPGLEGSDPGLSRLGSDPGLNR